MPQEVLMPALSPTMEEGTLAKWLVKEGDAVKTGDVIAEIETDKATMEVEALDDGKIGKLIVAEGTEHVPVNQPIAVLLSEGEDASDIKIPKQESASAQEEADGAATESQEGRGSGSKPASHNERTETATKSGATDRPGPKISPDPDIPEGTEFIEQTVREALRDAMAEEMRANPDVFVMGEEVAEYQGAYKVTQGLLKEFGAKRVVDTPITEYAFAGIGVGAAFAGLKPIMEFMTWNFAMQAIDHIVNSAAKTHYMSGGQMRCPIVFRGPNGAAARVAAQHSQDFAPWYSHVPGLKVIAPFSAADAKGLLKAAIRDPNPVVFLENEILYGQKFNVPKLEDYVLPIGKARVLREGQDVTLVSYSRGLTYAIAAAETLAEEGLEAEIIDLRSLRPLDLETILVSLAKTHRIVVIEESWPVCSVASEICARVAREGFDDLDAPPLAVSGADVPMPYAANLEKLALPDAERVIEAARKVLYRD